MHDNYLLTFGYFINGSIFIKVAKNCHNSLVIFNIINSFIFNLVNLNLSWLKKYDL